MIFICLAVLAYVSAIFLSTDPIFVPLTVDFQSVSGLIYLQFFFRYVGLHTQKLDVLRLNFV